MAGHRLEKATPHSGRLGLLALIGTVLCLVSLGAAVPALASSGPQAQADPPAWTQVRQGHSGSAVKTAQFLLRQHGALTDAADGEFGPKTLEATKRFQTDNGLEPDGVIGPKTWSKLVVEVDKGASGEAVKGLQEQLARLKYDVPTDGTFEDRTAAAVVAFKKDHELPADSSKVDVTGWQWLIGTPTPIGELRQKIVEIAEQEIGVSEDGNACDKYWWYGDMPAHCSNDSAGPWCAGFTGWVWHNAGATPPKSYYVPTWVTWGKDNGLFKKSDPQPGDTLVYGSDQHHIGIVYKVHSPTHLETIEGNSSDQVKHKTHVDPSSDGVYGYIAPAK